MRWRALLVIGLVAVVSGCSLFKSKKNAADEPAELVDFSPTVRISKAWDSRIGDGEGRLGLRMAPMLDDGRVYAASFEGELRALDAGSGKTLWRASGDAMRWSGGPAVAEGTLIAGTLDGDVVAFNPDSGTERWRAKVSSEVIGRPAISRGVAVVRSNDGRVYAFGILDGERRWVYSRDLPALTLRGQASPVISGGTAVLGYDTGELVALRLEDGVVAWEQRITEGEGRTELERMVDIDGDIVAAGSELYVAAYNSRVVALDAGSGRPLWDRDLSSYGGVSLVGDKLLVSDAAGTVWALDRRNGASMWRHDGLARRWLTTPIAHGDHVVVGDLDGYLHWLALDSGELSARQRIGRKPIRATPVTDGERVYAIDIEGKLVAFRAGS